VKKNQRPIDLGSVGMIVPKLGKDGRDSTEEIVFNNQRYKANVKVSSVTKNSKKFLSEEQKLEKAFDSSIDSFGLDKKSKNRIIGKTKAGLGQLFEEIVIQTANLNNPGSRLLDIPKVGSKINNIIRDRLPRSSAADIKRTNNQKNRKDVVRKLAQTRSLQKKAAGGSISGTGTDTVPALLTPGEFVVNKKSAEAYGYGNLKKINKYAKGGTVGVQKFQDGGTARTAAFDPGRVTSALFSLSIAISALTTLLGDGNEEISTALASFGSTLLLVGSTIGLAAKTLAKKIEIASEKSERAGKNAEILATVFNITATGIAAATAIIATSFGIAAKAAEKEAKAAIERANAIEAAAASARAEENKALQNSAIAIGGLAIIAGALAAKFSLLLGIVVAIGVAIGGFTGLLNEGFDIIKKFQSSLFDFTLGIIELADRIPGIDISQEIKNSILSSLPDSVLSQKLASRQSAFAAELQKSTNALNQLAKDSEILTEKFNTATTDQDKYNIILNTGRKNLEDLAKTRVGIEQSGKKPQDRIEQIDQELNILKSQPITSQQDVRQRALLEQERQQLEQVQSRREEINKSLETEYSQRFALARSIGTQQNLERDLNKGRKITFDQQGKIDKASIAAGGQLNDIYQSLLLQYEDEEIALNKLNIILNGTIGGFNNLNESLKKLGAQLGSKFGELFLGPIQDRLKAAQSLSGALDVAQGRNIQTIAPSQQKDVASNLNFLAGIGVLQQDRIDDIFRTAIPPDLAKTLEDSLRKEGFSEAAKAFLGIDVVQEKIELNTAAAVEELKKLNKEKEVNDGEQKISLEGKQLIKASNGGAIYAAGGTLVNFKPKGTDTVPAMLTPGEFVMQKSAVDKYGGGMMKEINAGTFSFGGFVGGLAEKINYAFRPLTRTGTALFQGIVSKGQEYVTAPVYEKLSGDKVGADIIREQAKARGNLAKTSFKNIGFSEAGEQAIQKQREDLESFYGTGPIATALKAADFAGETAITVVPEAGITKGISVAGKGVAAAGKALNIGSKTTRALGAVGQSASRAIQSTKPFQNVSATVKGSKLGQKAIKIGQVAIDAGKTAGKSGRRIAAGVADDAVELVKFGDKIPDYIGKASLAIAKTGIKFADELLPFSRARGLLSKVFLRSPAKIISKSLNNRLLKYFTIPRILSAVYTKDFSKWFDNSLKDFDLKNEMTDALEDAASSNSNSDSAPNEEPPGESNESSPPETKKLVDLVDFYEKQIGEPRFGKATPRQLATANSGKFDRYLERRLRANEIAVAKEAGKTRIANKGEVGYTSPYGIVLKTGERFQEETPSGVALPYEDVEKFRQGKRFLSDIDREYFAYLGATGRPATSREYKYFTQNYDDIIAGKDRRAIAERERQQRFLNNANQADGTRFRSRTFSFDRQIYGGLPLQSAHTGGMIRGYGQKPIYAEGGEYVMNKNAVKNIGVDNLNKLNGAQGLQSGGKMSISVPSELTTGLSSFEQSISNFASILSNNTIPNEITMSLGNQTISVNLNGAELLAGLMPEIQSMVNNAVVTELIDYDQKSQSSGPGSYSTQKSAERYNT
jgi:hypothetical protein